MARGKSDGDAVTTREFAQSLVAIIRNRAARVGCGDIQKELELLADDVEQLAQTMSPETDSRFETLGGQ